MINILLFSILLIKAFGTDAPCEGEGACPFDDLNPDEIRTVVRLTNASFPPSARPSLRWPIIRVLEPPKAQWLARDSSATGSRLAYATVCDLSSNQLIEFEIDLKANKIKTRTVAPEGTYPPVLEFEFEQAERLVRGNERWRDALRKRGLEHKRARLDTWAAGPTAWRNASERLLRVLTFYQDDVSKFWYWVPVEGLIITVDCVGAGRVVSVWDDGKAHNLAPGFKELNTSAPLPQGVRPLKPLLLTQPKGPSFEIQGQSIAWYKWRLRYSVDPMYGLQLHHVRYYGDCASRSVLYKISVGELLVPYGPAERAWRWRTPFDVGYHGLGKSVQPMRAGVDVPNNARLLECVQADESGGEAKHVAGCVAVWEAPAAGSLLHRHVGTDRGGMGTDAAPGRVLVLTLMATLGNYDYAFDYLLHMDGTLEVRTRLTGIVLPQGVATRVNKAGCAPDECIDMMNEWLVGPVHQHLFTYRIDLDVDGEQNSAVEVDVTQDGDSGAFSSKKKLLCTETARNVRPNLHRSWHVVNSGSRNRFGTPRGYALHPQKVVFPFIQPPNPVFTRTHFVRPPFWVTKYHDDEQAPGFPFPRFSGTRGGGGLADYVHNKESIKGEDIVLWYTFGVTHAPRPEEWPIMNVAHASGFLLQPFNFLSQNEELSLEGAGGCKQAS